MEKVIRFIKEFMEVLLFSGSISFFIIGVLCFHNFLEDMLLRTELYKSYICILIAIYFKLWIK